MPQDPQANRSSVTGEKTYVLLEVRRFIRDNWSFIGLLTLLLSVVTVSLAIFLPEQHQKQVTLSITSSPTAPQVGVGQLEPVSPQQAGDLAIRFLRTEDFGVVNVSSTYNLATYYVDVAFQAEDREALSGITPRVVSILETRFRDMQEDTLRDISENRLADAERELENGEAILARIEQQIAQFAPPGTRETEDPESLRPLEEERADTLAEIANLEAAIEYWKQVPIDAPQLAAESSSVEVMAESEVQQTRSLAPLFVLAVLSSLVVAVLAAIVRSAFSRG